MTSSLLHFKILCRMYPQSHNTKKRENASQENGKKVMQFFPTAVCDATAWRHSRLCAHWLMALVGGGRGAEGEVCILRSPGIAASPISLLSMGGVCGRRLTARKILFSGRQTCSLYLVLWLCACIDVDSISLF